MRVAGHCGGEGGGGRWPVIGWGEGGVIFAGKGSPDIHVHARVCCDCRAWLHVSFDIANQTKPGSHNSFVPECY